MRAAALVLSVLLAGGLLLGPGAVTASAEEGIGPTPGATASATPPPPSAAAGLISSPASGEFIPQRSVSVTGTKNAGSSVTVTVPGAAGCVTGAADAALATWSCTTPLPDGQGIGITATETLTDASTRVSTVKVDVLGPPTITAGTPQTAPGRASGTGRTGSTIHLSVDENEQVCHAPVTNGRWLCTIANGPGTYQVTARQDAGYGMSSASTPVTIRVNAAPPAEVPAPVTPVPARPTPVIPPQSPPSHDPPPSPSPSPPAHERADADTIPWLDRPIFPGPRGDGPTVREALTNWDSPTEFGTGLPSPRDTVTGGNWVWGAALALTFIGLIALPLRMLATALRGRHPLRAPRLTGRNRGFIPAEEDVPRNPWLLGAVPLVATAGLIVLAEGLNGEVRYLRLLVAVAAGLAILNLTGVAIVSRMARERLQVGGRLRFVPVLLLAAAVATILARLTGIEPPLVGGVLIGTGFTLAVPARPRALVNLAQVGAVLGLAVLAWFTHNAIGAVDGFWASATREAVATLCLAGLGSALILMLPLGALPGRVVLEWSPKAWFGSTLAVGTVTFAIILGHSQSAFPMLASGLIVAGFAAVCIATWAWLNYVQVSRA